MGCGGSKNAADAVVTVEGGRPAKTPKESKSKAKVGKETKQEGKTNKEKKSDNSTVEKELEQAKINAAAKDADSGKITTTAVVVAKATASIPADGDNTLLAETLSRQIAQQVTNSGDGKQSADNFAAAKLQKSINSALTKEINASEAQLKPATSASTGSLALKKSGSKKSLKSKPENGSEAVSLARDVPVALAEAVSNAVAKELSEHAGDSMGQNQIANSIDAIVAKSRGGNLRQEDINVRGIEVTTEIETDAKGSPIAIHASVIAISEVPANDALDAIERPVKTKSSASIAVAQAPITKTASLNALGPDKAGSRKSLNEIILGRSSSRKSVKEDHLSPTARKSLTNMQEELRESKKNSNRSKKSLEGDAAPKESQSKQTGGSSKANLTEDSGGKKRVTVLLKKSGSRASINASNTDSNARKSLQNLNEQLANERGVPLNKAASITLDGHAVKQSLTNLAPNRTSQKDLAAEPKAAHEDSHSRAKESLERLEQQLVTEKEAAKSKSKVNLAETSADSAPKAAHEDAHSTARRSLGDLQQQLAAEKLAAKSKSKASIADMSADSAPKAAHEDSHSTAKRSLEDLQQQLAAEKLAAKSKSKASLADTSIESAPKAAHEDSHSTARKSLDNLQQQLVTEKGAAKSKSKANLASSTNIPADSAPTPVHEEPKSTAKKSLETLQQQLATEKSAQKSKSNVNLAADVKAEYAAEQKHADAQVNAVVIAPVVPHTDAQTGGHDIQAAPSALKTDSETAQKPVVETKTHQDHRSVHELAADAKQSLHNLTHKDKGEKERHSAKNLAKKSTNDLSAKVDSKTVTTVPNQITLDDTAALVPPSETTVPIPTAEEHRNLSELAADAKKSVEKLTTSHHQDQAAQPAAVVPATKENEHHRSIKELAHEAKKSLDNLVHKSKDSHSRTSSRADLTKQDPAEEHSKTLTQAGQDPTDAKIQKSSSKSNLTKSSSRKSLKEKAAEKASVTNVASSDSDEGKEREAVATIETHVDIEVKKHEPNDTSKEAHKSVRDIAKDVKEAVLHPIHGSKNQLNEAHGATVATYTEVTPPAAANQSIHNLAKDVAKEIKKSTASLNKEAKHVHDAEIHVSTTTVNQATMSNSATTVAETIRNTTSLAKDEIKTQEHVEAANKKTGSRSNSSHNLRGSRPPSAKKASEVKPPSRKASTNNLHKSPSGAVGTAADARRSTNEINRGLDRRASASDLKTAKPPSRKGSAQILASPAEAGVRKSTQSVARSQTISGKGNIVKKEPPLRTGSATAINEQTR
ncbi:uncharacterized protein EV422DRAFT_567918 [Fimicolochytrium jonesii]|uniref:uncharacterized protein n=1 Tax=Fimicolochytrium jonesii TaxID=1396493 RepID=UPI0022FEE6BF|nr:uncharacterized protein EV422DRAFT_567918 [Fimicolochytrium jonesii]KAI8820494.1 hypothetical protein EV422DRAFT_567918 [Fimicolochytrium jonesii]